KPPATGIYERKQHVTNIPTFDQGQAECSTIRVSDDPGVIEPGWSHLSAQGRLVPTLSEAVAEKMETTRRFRPANGSSGRRTRRETIALSDNSPERGGRWWDESNQIEYGYNALAANGLRQQFPALIPSRPYCVDYLEQGLHIRPRDLALRRRHIQLNGPSAFVWMPHDIDRPDAYFAHR